MWPTPGYTKITSMFGKRISPTAGASNFHKGIDIGAPENAQFIAVVSGKITYVGFLGGGGYTITLSYNNMKISYLNVHILSSYRIYLHNICRILSFCETIVFILRKQCIGDNRCVFASSASVYTDACLRLVGMSPKPSEPEKTPKYLLNLGHKNSASDLSETLMFNVK